MCQKKVSMTGFGEEEGVMITKTVEKTLAEGAGATSALNTTKGVSREGSRPSCAPGGGIAR